MNYTLERKTDIHYNALAEQNSKRENFLKKIFSNINLNKRFSDTKQFKSQIQQFSYKTHLENGDAPWNYEKDKNPEKLKKDIKLRKFKYRFK